MKYISSVVWLTTCLTAVSAGNDLKVPGDSPLEFCDTNRDQDTLQIEKIDFVPNPPRQGEPLLVNFTGHIKNSITNGAYVKVTMKCGHSHLLTTTLDFCEQAGNFDLSCPLEAGKINTTKSVDMPMAIPPGMYSIVADAYAHDGESISCVKATIDFPRPDQVEEEL